jgi:Ca2+-binding EF-hand superfamily protein
MGSSELQESSGPPREPTDEDIARAFAVYDQEGVGEITTAVLEGEATR